MIDYILKFPSKEVAIQFGLANGFTTIGENGEPQSTLASHEHALYIIGEHFTGGDENIPATGDGKWWVLFRDLLELPIPSGGEQYIYWSSVSGSPPPSRQDAPSISWA